MTNTKFACVVLAMCMIIAPIVEATVTCGLVNSALAPCLGYLRGTDPSPSGSCCGGTKKLIDAAATATDRRTACACLKNVAGSISGLNDSRAVALPGSCGVNIPYKFSTSTNCNNIRA